MLESHPKRARVNVGLPSWKRGPGLLKKRGHAPEKRGRAPEKRGWPPEKEGLRPRKEGLRPRKEGLRPRKEGLSPRKEGLSPRKEGPVPRKEGPVPRKEGQTPPGQAVAPVAAGRRPPVVKVAVCPGRGSPKVAGGKRGTSAATGISVTSLPPRQGRQTFGAHSAAPAGAGGGSAPCVRWRRSFLACRPATLWLPLPGQKA
jgi:hypothetical protein